MIMKPAVTLAYLMLSASLLAHHSVPINFDQSREITIKGVLTEVVWINPHSRFRVDVKSENGSSAEWLVEMGAVNTMNRAGFKTELFKVGDTITIMGWPGRRDRAVHLTTAIFSDGTRLAHP